MEDFFNDFLGCDHRRAMIFNTVAKAPQGARKRRGYAAAARRSLALDSLGQRRRGRSGNDQRPGDGASKEVVSREPTTCGPQQPEKGGDLVRNGTGGMADSRTRTTGEAGRPTGQGRQGRQGRQLCRNSPFSPISRTNASVWR